jgi:hypothetical protein
VDRPPLSATNSDRDAAASRLFSWELDMILHSIADSETVIFWFRTWHDPPQHCWFGNSHFLVLHFVFHQLLWANKRKLLARGKSVLLFFIILLFIKFWKAWHSWIIENMKPPPKTHILYLTLCTPLGNPLKMAIFCVIIYAVKENQQLKLAEMKQLYTNKHWRIA